MEYLCDMNQDAPDYLKKYASKALPSSSDDDDFDTISQEFKANPSDFTNFFLSNSDLSFDFDGFFQNI
jgi:hypothetical protein